MCGYAASLISYIIFAGLKQKQDSAILEGVNGRHAYFVHSYRATESPDNKDWVLATSEYGGDFISAVKKGEVSRQPLVCSNCTLIWPNLVPVTVLSSSRQLLASNLLVQTDSLGDFCCVSLRLERNLLALLQPA
jgi:hypothetical protein